MIAISGALVLVAIALLVAGLVMHAFMLVYASIGTSLVAAVCLVVGVWIGRDQLFRGGGKAASRSRKGAVSTKAASTTAAKKPARARAGAGARTGGTVRAATGTAVRDDAEVVVVPGRPRYHLDSCRQVKDRSTETRELAVARDEGYVACSACRPESVLVARGELERDGAASTGKHRAAETVAVVGGQRRYHQPDCQVVLDAEQDGDEVEKRSVADAHADGLIPCTVCAPPAAD
ncbi:MAG: hypothetical protein ACRDMV_21270 [Streptosporangiales bacterium]